MSKDRLRVLFVDDSPSVLEGIGRMLYGMEREWDIRYADSGDHALTLIAEEAFDIVATDLKMPRMDGETLIQRIRALRPATRCIVLCGDPGDPKAMGMARQGYPIIEKPCEGRDIRATIEAVMRAAGKTGEATETEP